MLILCAALLVLNAPILGRSESQLKNSPPVPNPATSTQVLKRNQGGSKDNPLFVQTISPPKTEAEAAQIEEEKKEKLSLDRDMVLFTGILAAVALLQSFILYKQSEYNRGMERNQRIIERAYVKMSHAPPGLDFEEAGTWYWLNFRIENCGRTPARITARCINAQHFTMSQEAPRSPDYSDGDIQNLGAFLVPGDHIAHPLRARFPSPDVEQMVRQGQARFLIYGYVDYIDQFGSRHRAGYGREYNLIMDNPRNYLPQDFPRRSNLTFITEPDYNYDRERQRGEGDDWD